MWSEAVKGVADAVSSVSSTVAAYGPNEEGKVVKAAKKAGNAAKAQVKKVYPKCETEKEYKKKIVPLGLEGVDSRAKYNNMRAQMMEDAYNDAYDQVIQLYKQRLQSTATTSASESFADDFSSDCAQEQLALSQGKNVKGGCVGFALALLVSGGGLIGIFLSLI